MNHSLLRRGLVLILFVAAILSLTISCADEILPVKGQLMLVMSTNMAPPKDFDTFHVRIVEEGATAPLHDVDYTFAGTQAAKLPATLGLVVGSDPNKSYHITLEASRGGVVRLRREALSRIPDARVAALPLPIDGLCTDTGLACPLDANGDLQTCIAGSCQVAKVDVEKLPDYSEDAVFGRDRREGACFNTLQCFSEGKVASVRDVDCSIELETGGQGLNVAVLSAPPSDGICASNGCLIPLDRDPFTGPVVTGWRDVGNRVLLPRAICDRSLSLVTTTACATKATATCGSWSTVDSDASVADASLPFEASVVPVDGGEAGAASPVSPSSLTFVDGDMSQGSIDGTVTVGRAADESAITTYKLYWASGATQKLDLITTLPKTGQNLTHVLTGALLPGATHLIAVSVAGNAELPGAIAVGPIDNFTRNVGLGKGKPVVSEPTLLIDSTTDHLLITGFDKGKDDNGTLRNRPSLVRCKLDGTDCSYIDISAGESDIAVDWKMGAAIDTVSQKLLVVSGRSASSAVPMLFRCNLDGTSCAATELAPKADSGVFVPDPTQNSCPIPLVVDATHKKLYAVVSGSDPNLGSTVILRVYVCGLDGTNCEASIADYAWGECAAATLNEADSTLIVTRSRYTHSLSYAVPSLLRCSLDLSSCERKDIDPSAAGTTASFASATIAIDTTHQKILTLSHLAGSPAISFYRCNLDGEGCTSTALDPGPKFSFPTEPAIVIDTAHDSFLAFAQTSSGNFFIRCNLDGTGCASVGINSKNSAPLSAALYKGKVYTVTGATTGYDLTSFTAY